MIKAISRTLRMKAHRKFALDKIRAQQAQKPGLDAWIDLAMNFEGKGKVKIRTVQKRSEIMSLATAVADIKPKKILEIGTYRAGTLLIWSQIASELVVTCDLELPDYKQPLYEQFAPPGSSCKVKALKGDSHTQEFRDRVERELGGQVDFLFIDGDHTEVGVEQDFDMFHDLVRPGGLIGFHDIIEDQPLEVNQVYHLWKRLKKKLPEGATMEEFIDDPKQCGFGIGLVRMPS